MIHESQIVKDKESLAMSHGAFSQKQGPGFNPQITGLRMGLSWVSGLTHRRAIKEETIAVNPDWIYNQTCRLLHDIHVIYNV